MESDYEADSQPASRLLGIQRRPNTAFLARFLRAWFWPIGLGVIAYITIKTPELDIVIHELDRPGLEFSPRVHRVGDVLLEAQLESVFRLQNRSSIDVVIGSVSESCSCETVDLHLDGECVDGFPIIVSPNHTLEVIVRIRARKGRNREGVTVNSTHPESSTRLYVNYRGVAEFPVSDVVCRGLSTAQPGSMLCFSFTVMHHEQKAFIPTGADVLGAATLVTIMDLDRLNNGWRVSGMVQLTEVPGVFSFDIVVSTTIQRSFRVPFVGRSRWGGVLEPSRVHVLGDFDASKRLRRVLSYPHQEEITECRVISCTIGGLSAFGVRAALDESRSQIVFELDPKGRPGVLITEIEFLDRERIPVARVFVYGSSSVAQ
jgi:hypothetical protein